MKKSLLLILASLSLFFSTVNAGAQSIFKNDFSDGGQVLNTVGRGNCRVEDGVFKSKDSYASFGNNSLSDYTFSFRARAPKDAEQVQIWSGFRAGNRFDRYVLGIKGGIQDDLFMIRLGYMGMDKLMGVRPLGFHPVPGEWYNVKVQVCGKRIRVFLNDNDLPHIDIEDPDSFLSPSGQVTLGGSWIDTEFDDLTIAPLKKNALDKVAKKELVLGMTAEEKEIKRQSERKAYTALDVNEINAGRTEISLDGNWLFMPDYQMNDQNVAISTKTDDNDWHIMPVPYFYNPSRIWLHGETMRSPSGSQSKGVSDTYYQMETDRCKNYTFDYTKVQSAWYRQWVNLPEQVKGKKMVLTFDAVAKFADVYVNNQFAGSHIGMFGEFQLDVTKLMKPGKNLIAVKATSSVSGKESANMSNSIDFFYSSVRDADEQGAQIDLKKNFIQNIAHGFYGDNPGGIWQPVKLTITDPVRVDDVFIKPALDGAEFDITISNSGKKTDKFSVATEIVDKETGAILYKGLDLEGLSLKKGTQDVFTYTVEGLHPRLWTPEHPDLYDFTFTVMSDGKAIDSKTIVSGFRTFEARDGYFYLNGNRYWVRGGNHIPYALGTNDVNLADTFMQLMRNAHIDMTRTHTTPWNELWMAAADRNGIGVSYEGSWPWLMIHSTPIPDKSLLQAWETEYLSLIRKYRNHPSLFFWTINNEMKFYDNDHDKERAKQKMTIISNVIKKIRAIDPTRPISFDSNYIARGKDKKYGVDFMNSIDDGDIDDQHAYYNWYNHSLFYEFKGEFQRDHLVEGRPLISQEMATGYPNNETGHPTHSYMLEHQTPQTLVGYKAYDFADPAYFLEVQSFITGELAEALIRSNDKASGFMHFALLTWFRQVYDYKNIEPYPTYFALKRAFQPVLASAEIWGRHMYEGQKFQSRIYIVNNKENGTDLKPSLLRWEFQDKAGNILSHGKCDIPSVKHGSRYIFEPEIMIPSLPEDRVNARFILKLTENGLPVSENHYDLVLARKEYAGTVPSAKKIVLLDKDGMASTFAFLGVECAKVASVSELAASKADLCIVSRLEDCSAEEVALLRKYQKKGGKLLFLNSKAIQDIYPEYVESFITKPGDITHMEREEHRIFDGIDILDLRYFNDNQREVPNACNCAVKLKRCDAVTELGGHMTLHGYLSANVEERQKQIAECRGLTIAHIADGKGLATVSTMCTEKAATDPVAGKLLVNMINDLLED